MYFLSIVDYVSTYNQTFEYGRFDVKAIIQCEFRLETMLEDQSHVIY